MTSQPMCPRCATPLFAGRARDLVVFGCGACGGVFLDLAGAHRFWSALPHDAWHLAASAAHHGQRVVDVERPAPCPVCLVPMRRTTAATGAAVDDCPAHGAWYDRHELDAIAHAVHRARAGGPPATPAGTPPSGAPRGRRAAPGAGPGAWGAPAAAGAALAGVAAVGGAATLVAAHGDEEEDETFGEAAVEVAAEVVTDGVLEGGLEILGGVLGALFD